MTSNDTKNINILYQKEDTNVLMAFISENLAHARHVENERLMFNSIFSVFVAGVVVGVLQMKPCYYDLSITIIKMLFLISLTAFCLTLRWTCVFNAHYKRAESMTKKIAKEIDTTGIDNEQVYPFNNRGYTSLFFIMFDILIMVFLILVYCHLK